MVKTPVSILSRKKFLSFCRLKHTIIIPQLKIRTYSIHYDATVCVLSLGLQPRCDLNVEDSAGLTPLHLAVLEGHPVIIERLVGYGADLNSATSEGNTALHLTFKLKNMAAPSHLSPHILEVHTYRELKTVCVCFHYGYHMCDAVYTSITKYTCTYVHTCT